MTLHSIKEEDFLDRPLKLEMLTPTGKDGKVLKGKPLSPAPDSEWIRWENEEFEFYNAREKVLFKNLEYHSEIDGCWFFYSKGVALIIEKNLKIRNLLNLPIDIELTESAITEISA